MSTNTKHTPTTRAPQIIFTSYRLEVNGRRPSRDDKFDARSEGALEQARTRANALYKEGKKVTLFKLDRVAYGDGTTAWERTDIQTADGRKSAKQTSAKAPKTTKATGFARPLCDYADETVVAEKEAKSVEKMKKDAKATTSVKAPKVEKAKAEKKPTVSQRLDALETAVAQLTKSVDLIVKALKK